MHEFYELCRNWAQYNEDMHSIHIDLVRKSVVKNFLGGGWHCPSRVANSRFSSFELPDDCFAEGEVRPARPLRKKKVMVKKRGASEAGMDEVRILKQI